MILSLWRYSHFLLAIVSALFLVITSVTGSILALEPVFKNSQPYDVVNLDSISVFKTIEILKSNDKEVLELEITPEDFVKVSIVGKDGSNQDIYINPVTGRSLGNVPIQSDFFHSVTSLHRSLYLKSIGRFFIGFSSFLLLLISSTGVFLLAQRQGGFNKYFKIDKNVNFKQRSHVFIGKYFLIPVLIIGITGLYLSLERFSILPNDIVNHKIDFVSGSLKQDVERNILFKNTKLSEVQKLVFPFSKDAEDYFILSLKDRELFVNQYTGIVISEIQYPFVQLMSQLSLKLHTGRRSVIWSIVLLITSLCLLILIFSGFAISIKKKNKIKKVKAKWKKDEAEYVILVGSEMGNTYLYANLFYRALIACNKKVYIDVLNNYSTYEKALYLVVFTSTYGDGNAPSNARNFKKIFKEVTPKNKSQFWILGFGSLSYPRYCSFAEEVYTLFCKNSNYKKLGSLIKFNTQAKIDFSSWLKMWNTTTGMFLNTLVVSSNDKTKKEESFKVIKRTSLNIDDTMLLWLNVKKNKNFKSGDLLNITAPGATKYRQYSIAKIGDDILLSVKKHSNGLCSSFLCNLKEGDTVFGTIKNNSKFYFPKNSSSVWLVANGTGIAPYLGMLYENNTKVFTKLIWGGRTNISFNCYQDVLKKEHIANCCLALSKIEEKKYVQDIVLENKVELIELLKQGGVVMLCGSVVMQHAVLNILEEVITIQLGKTLEDFEANGQILTDCY